MTDPDGFTPLDTAHQAMVDAPDDNVLRLRFYERLAEGELFVMLDGEPDGEAISPALFDLPEGRFVVAFDREERLAQFAGRPVPYAALSGRALARLAAPEAIGLALNPDVAPSSILLPPEALGWLSETLAVAPEEASARIAGLSAPGRGLPEGLMVALDGKLASMGGLARKAYLAEVLYEDGRRGHLLGLTGAAPEAERALAAAINEALVFSGLEAGLLDVVFLSPSDPVAAELARVALRFDLPDAAPPASAKPAAPGTDPERPPILR